MKGLNKSDLYEQLSYQIDSRFQESHEPINVNQSYVEFLKTTLPRGWSADPKHIVKIGETLDAVDRGEIDRLAIHMPPRHGKSETVTYRYPVRCLQLRPTENVLVTGYNERFAKRFGRRTKNIAKSLGMDLDPGKQAADEWSVMAGGSLMTRGVGSPPTGVGFNRIVIDDPIRRRQDAESETYRESVWDWYTDDLYTRLEPGGAIILIMTLWHEDDIGYRAVASEPGRWTVLKLPAFAEENDPLGRTLGETLWPERYDVESLNRIKQVQVKNDGERSFQALYQQNPVPAKGNIYDSSLWQYYQVIPSDLEEQGSSWDFAFKDTDGSDYVVGQVWGRKGENRYLLDQVRGKMDFNASCSAMVAMQSKWPLISLNLVEDKANGPAVINSLKGRVHGLVAVDPSSIGGSKQARAYSTQPLQMAGNLFLPDPKVFDVPWIAGFITEHSAFPSGKNDDQVDSQTMINIWWMRHRHVDLLEFF